MPDNVSMGAALRSLVSQTVAASKLTDLCYGTVTSESPLTIFTDQKVKLYEQQIKLCRNVTDYEMDIEVSHQTEEKAGGSGDAAFEAHRHEYKGRKKIKVYNALKTGDKVLVARIQGSQERVVIDRVQPAVELKGEWL